MGIAVQIRNEGQQSYVCLQNHSDYQVRLHQYPQNKSHITPHRLAHSPIFLRLPLTQNLWFHLVHQNIPSEEIRNLPQTVRGIQMRRHTKHLIQLFERLPFGLRDEQQDKPKANNVPHVRFKLQKVRL